jgi:hypothetical protein
MEGEEPSLYHILRPKARREARAVHVIQDGTGTIHTTAKDILRSFLASLPTKFRDVPVDVENIRALLRDVNKTLPLAANLALDAPITIEEKPNKGPGNDGIRHDYFPPAWDVIKHDMITIINQMYKDGQLTNKQKHGIMVCIPKIPRPLRMEDYRPLTLLNADYKLLTRILAIFSTPS